MSKTKIGTIEAVLVILTVIISHSILSLPRDLIVRTKSATIINIIYVTIICTLFALLISKLFKKFGNADILDVSEYLGGKIFKHIVGAIFIFYYMVSSSILLRNFCEALGLVYFQMTPIIFIILLFVIGSCISNRLGFNISLKVNLIILPIALVSIIFIFIANFKSFDIQKIFPILGGGFKDTFITGLLNISAFEGLKYLYFLPPYLKEPEKYKKISILSAILTGLYLILCVSIILFIFPSFFTTNEIMPLYSAARYISFGNFLQRLESIFMMVWILSFISYLTIATKFAISIFQKMTNIKNTKEVINVFGLLTLAISMFPKNLAVSTFGETKVYSYVSIAVIFIFGITILVLANLKKRKERI